MATEQKQIRLRRDTTARWAQYNPVLAGGEMGVDVYNGDARLGTAGDVHYADLPSFAQFDIDGGTWAPAVKAAIDAYNNGKYQTLQNVYVWSYANNASGAGPGGVSIDPTAAANVARNTTAKASEGYVAIGRDALGAATRARNCIAIGSKALGLGDPGFGNIAIGTFALSNVQGENEYAATLTGSRNIGIGSLAGYFVSSGYMNTFIGRDSGQTVTTGYQNTGIGYRALTSGMAPVGLDGTITNQYPVAAINNTAVGVNAGALVADSNNTFIGASAGTSARLGVSNTAVGQYAAALLGRDVSENGFSLSRASITGTYSQSGKTITVTANASGAVAGKKIAIAFTSGGISDTTAEMQWLTVATVINVNTFTIASPISLTATGNVSVSVVETSTAASVGGQNTYLGQNAGGSALNSDGNQTMVGESAGQTSTGARNTLVGSRSGYNLTTGTDNTHVGYNAGRALTTGGGQATESNTTVLGSGAAVSGSNQVQLGNSTTTTYVYGTVQNRSDRRDKADIRDTVLGLDFINALRPVDYRWDMREDYLSIDEETGKTIRHKRDGSKKRERFHHGFVAQEVGKVIESTGVDFGGYQDHEKNGGAKVQSIGYDEIIAPHVRATQQLAQMVETLTAKVAELEGKLADGNS